MTLQGYWNGLHPDSEISKTYKLSRYGVRDSQAQYPYPEPFEYIYLPSPEDTNRYWTDYLTTLKKAGIDYVKIDNEAALDYLTGTGVAEMRAHVSKTARAVALQVFGSGNLINCMAGSPRCYNAFLAECSDPSASLRSVGQARCVIRLYMLSWFLSTPGLRTTSIRTSPTRTVTILQTMPRLLCLTAS